MDSITSQQDKQSEEALILLRRAKAYIIHIKRGYDESETVEQIFADERLVRLRKSLFLECERLSQFPNFRREALDLFWSYCCYKPITYLKIL
ncbi:hypothetical protein Mgra_00003927 [Meloidogyne graminicola]|uniref:Uncharacterized protein n=1 Tax=Meloidogyne graminicola TaxID=189291 RepID=A0A8S9ZU01_9BILA|nr:hypothetical protein Mgra_00003927 [Meloidogyne graminicola]